MTREHLKIRKLARSDRWLNRCFVSEKYSQPMFKGTVSEWCKDEVDILQWGLFYKAMYEIPEKERPRKSIWEKLLNYDLMLDDWLEKRRWEREQKSKMSSYTDNKNQLFKNF